MGIEEEDTVNYSLPLARTSRARATSSTWGAPWLRTEPRGARRIDTGRDSSGHRVLFNHGARLNLAAFF
eukprot:730910-Pyramimonas_sp.AAC.1